MTAKKLIDELAPYEPINDDSGGCVFCGGPGGYIPSERYQEDHRSHCPWVRARRYLGDEIPVSRRDQ